MSTGWPGVFGARVLDRLGSDARSAPRDALVAMSAADASRGKAFGLEGIGDNLGAFLGPMIAIVLLRLAHVDLQWIFFIAVVPGVRATLMILFVREAPTTATAATKLALRAGLFPRS